MYGAVPPAGGVAVLGYMMRIFWPVTVVPVSVTLKPFALPLYGLLVALAPPLELRSMPIPQPYAAYVRSTFVAPEIQQLVAVHAVAVIGDGEVHVVPSP